MAARRALNSSPTRRAGYVLLCCALALTAATLALASPGVKNHQKISAIAGDFTGELNDDDWFCITAGLGDIDGDGVEDLAVGAPGDDDGGGFDRGAVWILFLIADGTVREHQKISDTEGGFTGVLDDEDYFGYAVESLGDFDGDGPSEWALAVSAVLDDDGGLNRGAVWILFMDENDTVMSHQKISGTEGGFAGPLHNIDEFGCDINSLGDLDGDGVVDLAVGARSDDDSGYNRGAVWILFLNEDGTVRDHQKINDYVGGFDGVLDDFDSFGESVTNLGYLDGDGVIDLAVGAPGDDDGDSACGAVWILFLNADGTVRNQQKISATEGGFTGELESGDLFGSAGSAAGGFQRRCGHRRGRQCDLGRRRGQ